MIEVENLTKVFYTGGQIEVPALRGVSFKIESGEMVAIMGPSGSGKSTLMHLLGCLDTPTSGSYWLEGVRVDELGDAELTGIRNRKIGFVFQSFNLLPRTTAVANVELPLLYSKVSHRRQYALDALARVGLAERANHRPNELSGGEQQRVAIARALITNPSIILADEPTGNVDTKASEQIMEVFKELNREEGITVVIVTHEADIASKTSRVLHVRDGGIENEEERV